MANLFIFLLEKYVLHLYKEWTQENETISDYLIQHGLELMCVGILVKV